MSSPYSFGGPSPHAMSTTAADDDHEMENEIPRRLMRVKVLYTFDEQNKTFCLTRLPNALNIPTVALDDETNVGVIELKTCIEAIVTASPELVAKLGHDYTVYAYDYSEYETPLVGQGMLSWVLASASSNANAPASESKTMITGKVCKNILGLFSNGIKETLEVKLKLVPVPTFLQSEYIESMEKYRNLSKVIPEGFDHAAWTSFLKANPSIGAMAAQNTQQAPIPAQRTNSGGVESLHQLLTQSNMERHGSHYSMSQGYQGSRPGSPTPSFRSSTALQQVTQDSHSRPASRASTVGDRQMQNYNTAMESNVGPEPEQGEGPPKKRARVVQTEWRGRSQFGPRADSLRVTASTAASIRVHKPTPQNPVTGNSLEPPPRAPTPRPNELPQTRGRPSISSGLRNYASSENTRTYVSPYAAPSNYSESAAASSDDERMVEADDSPVDMPSSPPVLTQDSPMPSSPALPSMSYNVDSGFMSGSMAFPDSDFDLPEPNKGGQTGHQNHQMEPSSTAPIHSDSPWQIEMPGPTELLPTTVKPPPLHYKYQRRAEAAAAARATPDAAETDAGAVKTEKRGRKRNDTKKPAPPPTQHRLAPLPMSAEPRSDISIGPSSTMVQTQIPFPPSDRVSAPPADTQAGSISHASPANAPRPFNAAAPSQPPHAVQQSSPAPQSMSNQTSNVANKRNLPRSHTWSAGASQEPRSDGPLGPTSDSRSASPRPRSGAGAKRKKVIEEKLMQNIGEGKMPDFCACCGEIRTPTWRKAFVKIVEGHPPEDIVTNTKEEGAIAGVEIVAPQPNEVNFVPKYKLYKKHLTNVDKTNKDFAQMTLCNSCGLYFSNWGLMRPREKWESKPKEPSRKRGRPKKKKVNDDQPIPTSEVGHEPMSMLYTDQICPTDQPEHSEPMQIAQSVEQQPEQQPTQRTNLPRASSAQPQRHRSSDSQGWDNAISNAALARAVNSSPVRMPGSQESPIDLEEGFTPKPTRRLLFPSPRKEGEVKSLGNSNSNSGITLDKTTVQANFVLEDRRTDKENHPPANEDGFDDLFEDGFPSTIHATPKPNKTPRPLFNILKTPTSTRSKRAALTPKAGLDDGANYLATTPSRSMNLNRLRNTPKGVLTPFTAQMNDLFGTNGGGNTSNNHGAGGGAMDFSSLMFNSPSGRSLVDFSDFDFGSGFLTSGDAEHGFGSDAVAGFGFELYEDPLDFAGFGEGEMGQDRDGGDEERVVGEKGDRDREEGQGQGEGGGAATKVEANEVRIADVPHVS
ncbi:hypothetical protein K490DRAFT_65656 [Saccharata proteae CBS 121410]|uniref:GATA-type domain-containing protein n=1 Tax=Saccharata proteae CBS 121410 TaxID=1314787 RepID=A0A9P4LX58_9PEZI|nr:hypothetical protein K490DRAFT_65656 [Saccharata proteae CBS 121410]